MEISDSAVVMLLCNVDMLVSAVARSESKSATELVFVLISAVFVEIPDEFVLMSVAFVLIAAVLEEILLEFVDTVLCSDETELEFVDTLLCKEVMLVEFVDTELERVAISVAAAAPAVSSVVI